MAGTLTATLIEIHRGPERRGGWGRSAPASRLTLKPEHVVLEGEAAALTMQLFEGLGRDRFACDLTLVSGENDSLRRPNASAEQVALERTAHGHGAVFSRFGNGPGHQVYVARFGAPGRLVLGTNPRIAGAGALSALALVATPVEAAAALAGFPFECPAPEVMVVRLIGKPPGWLGGEDVTLELSRRIRCSAYPSTGARARRVLEFQVLEPGALSYATRAAIASRAHELGALAALFPSDETTRRFLKAQGREADWKPLVPDSENGEGARLELDFATVEPLLVRAREVVRLQDLNDAPVGAVWIGPETSLADLARFQLALAGRSVSRGLDCVVTPGSRQVQETAARDGLLAALVGAGVAVRMEAAAAPRPREDRGLSLACGVPLETGRHGWQIAGVAACAAAAAAGCVADPRAAPAESPDGDETYVVNDRLLVRPAPEGGEAHDERRPPPLSPGIMGPLRGVVLLAVGDHVGVSTILPWGARVRPHALKIDVLATFVFAGLDPTFVARAHAEGGGFLVAGRGLGAGARREQVALVLVMLGIRGILARSFDPEFRRQLRQHGVLALRFGTDADADTVQAGDELEIPDLPDGLEPGKPLVVRDLTRGAPCTVHHDLDEAGVLELRAGGMLAALRGRRS